MTAERLAAAGLRVYGTRRRVQPGIGAYATVAMNVDDDASVRAAVGEVIEREGRIDVVLNNAGIGMAGSIEDTTIEEAKRQLETNFFGVVRVVRAVLPHMREAGRGKIINVSSIGGLVSLPFQSFYSASKFAVEALTEALRHEVRPFGIKVCCIEPGDFKTEMTAKRIFAEAAESEAYGAALQHAVGRYARDEENGSDPAVFAALVEKLIATREPKARYLVGAADQKAAAALKRLLPYRVFERLFRAIYGF